MIPTEETVDHHCSKESVHQSEDLTQLPEYLRHKILVALYQGQDLFYQIPSPEYKNEDSDNVTDTKWTVLK